MAQAAPVRALPAGTALQGGQFAISHMLGEGGFGITYKGAHRFLQRAVAIKELFPDGAVRVGNNVLVSADRQDEFRQERENILQEARLIASLNSPHIVDVHDMFQENGTAYIVMEYLEGQTLQERIDTLGELPLAEVQKIAFDTCEALAEIHSYSLLHRDIKPANIMLTGDNRTVLIDFGAAREFVIRQTRRHTRILTEDYAAPEQYSDQARFGPYTDIFCLGATLFHALTRTPPPGALKRLLSTNLTISFPPGFHGPLCSAIQQALHLNVLDRPQNIEALRDILLGSGESSASVPLALSTSQPITSPTAGRGLIQNVAKGAGRLSSRGLILVISCAILLSAVSATAASGVVPFRSIASTLVSASRLPTPTGTLQSISVVLGRLEAWLEAYTEPIPTATFQSISVVPTRIPTFTPTPVAPKPTPTATLTRAPTPAQVLLHAHTNVGANLRSGPSVVYAIVGVLAENTRIQPVAQTADRVWLKLDSGVWIFSELVEDIPQGLPVETNLPAPPRLTPTPTPLPPVAASTTLTPIPTSPAKVPTSVESRLSQGNDCAASRSVFAATICFMRNDGNVTLEEASELLDLESLITTSYNFTKEFQGWIMSSMIVIQRECQEQRGRHVPMLEIFSALLTIWSWAPAWQSESSIAVDTMYFLECV